MALTTHTLTVDLADIFGGEPAGVRIEIELDNPRLVYPLGNPSETAYPTKQSKLSDANGRATFELAASEQVGNYKATIGDALPRVFTMPAEDSRLSALGDPVNIEIGVTPLTREEGDARYTRPPAPPNQTEAVDYSLRVPATSGSPEWVVATGGSGGGGDPRQAGEGLTLTGNTLSVTNPFTADNETKLDGIETGAEVNVQSDWNLTTATADGFIKNKPTLFSPSQSNIYDSVKDILQAGSNITITADDADHELSIAGQSGGGGGGNPRLAGTGLTLSGNTLSVTNPFTDADETKLDNISANAEVNVQADWSQTTTTADDFIRNKPDISAQILTQIETHVHPDLVAFAAEDGDTEPSTDLLDGQIGFYQADGTTQLPLGDVKDVAVFYIPKKAADFGQDATLPTTPLSAVDVGAIDMSRFMGSTPHFTLVLMLNPRGSSQQLWYHIHSVENYGTAGWKLVVGHFLLGSYTPASQGVSWNVSLSVANTVSTHDIIDLHHELDHYVLKADLKGRESDRYASYTNASGNTYWDGTMQLISTSTGQPIRQPDIANGTVLLRMGTRLRTDRDPNHLVWAPTRLTSADVPSGTVFHVSIWNDPTKKMTITTSGDSSVTGSGSAQVLNASATVSGVSGITDVADFGDYFLIAEEEPTQLAVEIPYTDILGAPWVKTDGSNVTDALKSRIQGDNESQFLSQDFRVNVTNVDSYVQFSVSGSLNVITIRILKTNTADAAILTRLLHPDSWVRVGDFEINITSNRSIANIGTGTTFTANYTVVNGAKPTGSSTYKVEVVGEDVHRGQLARAAFKDETPSVAGKGGTDGQVWTKTSDGVDWADASGSDPADASTTVKGIVELATNAEAETGTDSERAATPAGVRAAIGATDAAYAKNIAPAEENALNQSFSAGGSIPLAVNVNAFVDETTVSGSGKVICPNRDLRDATLRIAVAEPTNQFEWQLRRSHTTPPANSDMTTYGQRVGSTYQSTATLATKRDFNLGNVLKGECFWIAAVSSTVSRNAGDFTTSNRWRGTERADLKDYVDDKKPSVSGILTVTSSWQTVQSGFASDDVVTVNTQGAYANEASNIAVVSVTYKFSDMPTSGRWCGIRANINGARVEIRRNGSSVQARSQGQTANTQAWTVKF